MTLRRPKRVRATLPTTAGACRLRTARTALTMLMPSGPTLSVPQGSRRASPAPPSTHNVSKGARPPRALSGTTPPTNAGASGLRTNLVSSDFPPSGMCSTCPLRPSFPCPRALAAQARPHQAHTTGTKGEGSPLTLSGTKERLLRHAGLLRRRSRVHVIFLCHAGLLRRRSCIHLCHAGLLRRRSCILLLVLLTFGRRRRHVGFHGLFVRVLLRLELLLEDAPLGVWQHLPLGAGEFCGARDRPSALLHEG